MKFTEEHLQNMINANKARTGFKHTKEVLLKISNASRGRKVSLETRKKLSKKLKGRVLSEEWKRKQSIAHLGKKCSEETKKKMSDSAMGRKNSTTHSENIRKAVIKIWANRSKEEKAKIMKKISNSLKGSVPWNKGIKQWKFRDNPNLGKTFGKLTRSRISLARGGTGIPYENTEYGVEFTSSLKEQIRFRDKYKCQVCGCPQLENGKQLDVHHIDYDKQNCKISNLISLCVSCHRKTNARREYWKNYLIIGGMVMNEDEKKEVVEEEVVEEKKNITLEIDDITLGSVDSN